MKKRIASVLVVLIVLVTVILSACSSSSNKFATEIATSSMSAAPQVNYDSAAASDSRDNAAVSEQKSLVAGSGNSLVTNPQTAGNSQPDQPRKIIKNATLSIETKEFENTIPAIIKLVEDAGGYIENQTIDGISLYQRGDYYERTGNLIARIPAEKLSDVTSAIGNAYNIVSQSEYINDITDQYYDASAHLDMLKTQEKRLLELLKKAEKLEDIIKLESALTDCRYQIESLTGRLRRMDNQVSYSTLDVSIREVVEYNEISKPPKTFWEKMTDSLKRSGKNIAYTFENGIFFIIEELPVILINLVVWGIIIFAVYRLFKFILSKQHFKNATVKGLIQPNRSESNESNKE